MPFYTIIYTLYVLTVVSCLFQKRLVKVNDYR